MVQFRPQGREVIAKVVYYGPPLGGKTTNLRSLYNGYPDDTRGELVVVPAGGDRTIFFDFLSLEAGNLRGMKLRVQLYTVPGQVHYNATRQVVLRGIDAAVFVADSQREMVRANRESWENLKDNLLLQGLSLQDMPHVLQYNKRDLADVLTIDDIDALLNQYNAPFFEAVASTGIGVEETLQGVVKLLVRSLRDRFKLGAEHARPDAGQPAVAVPGLVAPVATPPPAAAGGARIFAFGQVVASAPVVVAKPIPVAESTRLAEPVPHAEPLPGPPGATFEDGEEPDVTRKVRVPPFGEEAVIPPETEEAEIPPGDEDPFAWEASVPAGADDDVFGAALPEAGEAADGEAPPAQVEASDVAAGPQAEEAPPEAFGFGALTPVPEVPTPLVGDEPYEVAAGPREGAPERDGAGAQVGSAAMPATSEEPGFVLPGLTDRLRTQVEPAFVGFVEDRIGDGARPGGDTPRVEFATIATEGAAAGSEEPAAEVPAPVEEAPFGEADEVGSETTAQRLFLGAGFVDSASTGEAFAEDDGFSTASRFEAEVAQADLAAAVLLDREGDTAAVHAEDEGEDGARPVAGFEAVGEPAAGCDAEGVPAGQFRAGLGGEGAAVGETVVGHDDGWPVEEPGEREGEARAAEADLGGEEPPAVVEIPPSAIRRVAPRALAQIGEVRELEIEVPVPAPWTGGKRMTLQLRLTLVPQEEEHGE